MSSLLGKAAFITGAGRGQGRAHAVRLATAGADIIAVDICADMPGFSYPMATQEDLEHTRLLVEKVGRRASLQAADVRDRDALDRAFKAGLDELGTDAAEIVIANAGAVILPPEEDESAAFTASIELMLVGPWNTLRVTSPPMVSAGRGGSIVITSSTSALAGFWGGSGGGDGYTAAKAGLVGLMQLYANLLAPHRIRVNTIHPTGVRSGMTENEAFIKFYLEASANPPISSRHNALPVDILEPEDVADAVAWLVSDEAKYVTGVALPVDAGFVNS